MNDNKLSLIEALGFFACMVCVAQKMFEQIKEYYSKQNDKTTEPTISVESQTDEIQ